ncbi:MAG: ribosomal protein S18-alanine N-acetyltransferase [Defluviitaleaceae bacterium]|nr:ribosomal protein S18-alanine N-acetyltransferase [Defluviitaleaceae bacterium]
MCKIRIEPMTIHNYEQLYAMELVCFDDPWPLKIFQRQLLVDYSFYIIAYVDDVPAGYAGMWHLGDEGEIMNFAVLPDFRGLGVGDAMLAHYIGREGVKWLFLDVRASNTHAQELYKRHGFAAFGLRKDYYKNPNEDALTMRLEVKHEKA